MGEGGNPLLEGRGGSVGIYADYGRFCTGLAKAMGRGLEEEGEFLSLAFEPWFTEIESRAANPCLRLRFRRVEGRIFLEGFTIEAEGELRDVPIEAAHDALQAWMDCTAD